jgi:PAS domain S-box-containing protein
MGDAKYIIGSSYDGCSPSSWIINMQQKKFYHFLMKERKRREHMESDLQLRLKQQESVASFGEHAISIRSLDELFDLCVRVLTDVLKVDFAKILELDPVNDILLLRAGIGWRAGMVGQEIVSAGANSPAGYTLLYEEPILVKNLDEDPRFHNPTLLRNHRVVSGMSVAIIGREHPFGVLGVYTTEPREFSQHDARFLKSIANILASFIERSRVETELRHSHNELSIILNGVAEAVTVFNPVGQIIYANQAAANLLGYPSPEILMRATRAEMMAKYEILDENGSILPEDTLPSRRALRGEKPAAQRMRFRIKATGEERWSILDSMPVFDAAGNVIMAVNIFRDITEMMREEQMQHLLAEAGRLLYSSLDYKTTLANLTELAVAHLSDWCVVHLIDENGGIQQVGVSHKDPQKVEMAKELQKKYPPDWEKSKSLANVLRTGNAEYYPEITDELLAATARDAEHLDAIRAIGMRSAMLVPLVARDQPLGVISLIWAESNRRYTREEVAIVQELAHRAAIAIQNAQLFQQTQALNAELEMRVAIRTRELETANQRLHEEINERIRTFQALHTSEILMNGLFESAPDATVLVDQKGMIRRVNRQAEMLFGYDRDEIVGQSINKLIPVRYHHNHKRHLSGFFKRSVTRTMGVDRELFACNKDGIEFPVDVMLSPLSTGSDTQVISSIRDTTKQKKLQAELAETHQRLLESIEAERISLARELHDGPMQDLYGVLWNYEVLKNALEGEEADLLENTQDTIQVVVNTLREICGELRPVALDHFGLEKGIHTYISKIRESHPELVIEVKIDEQDKALSDRVKVAVYRVIQNALNNIVRHSQAKYALVSFQQNGPNVHLHIQDDGCGFVVPERWVELARSGHFGLVGMIERIHAVGGHLNVISAPGKGTTISVEVPVSGSEADSYSLSDNGRGKNVLEHE